MHAVLRLPLKHLYLRARLKLSAVVRKVKFEEKGNLEAERGGANSKLLLRERRVKQASGEGCQRPADFESAVNLKIRIFLRRSSLSGVSLSEIPA